MGAPGRRSLMGGLRPGDDAPERCRDGRRGARPGGAGGRSAAPCARWLRRWVRLRRVRVQGRQGGEKGRHRWVSNSTCIVRPRTAIRAHRRPATPTKTSRCTCGQATRPAALAAGRRGTCRTGAARGREAMMPREPSPAAVLRAEIEAWTDGTTTGAPSPFVKLERFERILLRMPRPRRQGVRAHNWHSLPVVCACPARACATRGHHGLDPCERAARYSVPTVKVGARLLCRRVDFQRARDAYLAERERLGVPEGEDIEEWIGSAPPMDVLVGLLRKEGE